MKKHRSNLLCLLGLVCSLWLYACKQEDQSPEVTDVHSFESLLEAINEADSATQISLIEAFLDTAKAPAIVNDTTVYFYYYGQSSSVQIAGDFSGWSTRGNGFERASNTLLWYKKMNFEPNARLDYKLVINGSSWILDPKNLNKISGGFGPNSELAMPAYEQPWEIVPDPGVLKGKTEQHQLGSQLTGKSYTIWVYTPAGYDESVSYPTVYFQDGEDYLNLASATTVLDNLIGKDMISPVLGVFVKPTDRNLEYAFEGRFSYAQFFVEELVPFIDENYATASSADQRAVVGDSYGGNISAIIAFKYPEVFGNCGIHSGAFQPNNFHTNSLVMDGVKKDIKVATIWGSYEGTSLPPNMRKVKDYLIETGYSTYWRELPEGHSWGLWRATLDEMLTFFYPKGG